MRPHGSSEQLEERRRAAVRAVIEDGESAQAAAKRAKVTVRTMKRWLASFRSEGDAGLTSVPSLGRRAALDAKDLERLEKILLRGAVAAGFDSELWTCRRIAKVIQKQFGVSFHKDHVSRILGKMGWTPQRPETRAVERDESAITQWRRKEWPRIRKTPSRRRPP